MDASFAAAAASTLLDPLHAAPFAADLDLVPKLVLAIPNRAAQTARQEVVTLDRHLDGRLGDLFGCKH